MKFIKQQSKLIFIAIHKSYENCASYVLKQNEVLMDKRFYLGFAVLELSKICISDTYYDKLHPCFGEKNLHLHYMDADTFILRVNTKDIIKDLSDFRKFVRFHYSR